MIAVKKEKITNIILFILFGIVSLFAFATMDYQDGVINAQTGYMICDSILHGTFGNLFDSLSWSYGITLYAIYAVWSIPIVIIDLITGRKTNIWIDRSAELWYKLLLVLFFCWCLYWIYKIVIEMTGNRRQGKLMAFFVATSPLMFFPPFAITQCDVITLAFSLGGIYYLMKKRDGAFIAFFAVAVTMKYMALFIFIPLFFFRYKKAKQMATVGIGASSLILLTVFFLNFSDTAKDRLSNPQFYDVTAQIQGFFNSSNISIGVGGFSLVVAYFITICILAHFIKEENNYCEWILWFCLAGWYTLFVFYEANVYWYVLIAPFLVLIMLNRTEYASYGILAAIILANFMLMERVASQSWVFGGGQTFSNLLLRDVLSSHSTLLRPILNRLTLNYFSILKPVYVSVILVFSISLLIVFRPKKEKQQALISTGKLEIAIGIQIVLLIVWISLSLAEAIRLTKGVEYGLDYVTFSEGVECNDDSAIIGPGESQQFSYIALETGEYILTVYADNLDEQQLIVAYYYNEEIPLEYQVTDQGEDFLKVEFTLPTYLEGIHFEIRNDSTEDITFYYYLLNEKAGR